MSPAERKLVINRLRLVAYNYYSGKTYNPVTLANLHHNGICYAAQHAGLGRAVRSWYRLLGDAFELLGMHSCEPFDGELHGEDRDWTVRPMFCLLMADALEQME